MAYQNQVPFQKGICFRDVFADTHLGLACDLTRLIILDIYGLDEDAANRDIRDDEAPFFIGCGAIFAVIRQAGDLDMGVGKQGEPVFCNGPALECSPAQKHDIDVQPLSVALDPKGDGTEFSGFLLNDNNLAAQKDKIPAIIAFSVRCFGADTLVAFAKFSKQADICKRNRGAVGVEDLAGNNPVGLILDGRFHGTCPGTCHILSPQVRGIQNGHLPFDKRAYRIPQGEIDDPGPGLERHPHNLIAFRGIIGNVDPFILILDTFRGHLFAEKGGHHAANSEDCTSPAADYVRIRHLDGTIYGRRWVGDW